MVAPHQYAKHMPNAPRRYKLLLTRILSVTAKTFDFLSCPKNGIFPPGFGTRSMTIVVEEANVTAAVYVVNFKA